MTDDLAREIARHSRSDIEYIDGLQAHMDEGGLISPKNISDLIAMVRWNAEHVLAALSDAAVVERVAAKLTESQRKAVLWLPETGEWSMTRAHWTVANAVAWLERKLPEIAEAKVVGQNGGANDLRHRLTPLGLAVRRALMDGDGK